jgi:hypothetical protein
MNLPYGSAVKPELYLEFKPRLIGIVGAAVRAPRQTSRARAPPRGSPSCATSPIATAIGAGGSRSRDKARSA